MGFYHDGKEWLHLVEIKAPLTAFLYALATWIGYPDAAVIPLTILLLADFALGLARSFWDNAYPFSFMRIGGGFWKIFRVYIALFLLIQIDEAFVRAFPLYPAGCGRDLLIVYFAVNEGISCADHLNFFGMPLPEPFVRRLRAARKMIGSVAANIPSA